MPSSRHNCEEITHSVTTGTTPRPTPPTATVITVKKSAPALQRRRSEHHDVGEGRHNCEEITYPVATTCSSRRWNATGFSRPRGCPTLPEKRQRALSRIGASDWGRSDSQNEQHSGKAAPRRAVDDRLPTGQPFEGPYTAFLADSPKRFRRGLAAASSRRRGRSRPHDMKARSRQRGEQPHLMGPFHAGGAKRDAVFYTPHGEGWCRRTHRGGATCQNRNLYRLPPQKRVYRGSTQEVPI